MSPEYKLQEVFENREDLEPHQQKFVESVHKFFEKHGFLTKMQTEWIDLYYEKLFQLYSYE